VERERKEHFLAKLHEAVIKRHTKQPAKKPKTRARTAHKSHPKKQACSGLLSPSRARGKQHCFAINLQAEQGKTSNSFDSVILKGEAINHN
jgi:hypothetical protein